MSIVTIHRLEAKYRLPASHQAKSRLDGILEQVLESALEAALERAGVRTWEQICIRRLHVPVRLNLAMADAALLQAWIEALTRALLQARSAGPSEDLVRYRSRTHALFDVATGVATDRFERLWAWRLAGVWRGPDSPDGLTATNEWVARMSESPEAIASLLEVLATAVPVQISRGLMRRLTTRHWLTLAHAACRSSGISARALEDTDEPGTVEVASLAQRAVEASALARLVSSAGSALLQTIELRRAVAALIALQQEPGGLQRRIALVRAIADTLHPASRQTASLKPQESAAQPSAPARQSARPDLLLPIERALTEFGGLLFLLSLVPVGELLSNFGQRPFRWVLHQLALLLVDTSANDPAVLAFAGLPPNSEPPSRTNRPPADAEQGVLRGVARGIETAASKILEDPHPLLFVCRRRAEVIADPGWIEIHFPMSEVSTEIRRAGLDLDPGWLPWLGVVMRFVYE